MHLVVYDAGKHMEFFPVDLIDPFFTLMEESIRSILLPPINTSRDSIFPSFTTRIFFKRYFA